MKVINILPMLVLLPHLTSEIKLDLAKYFYILLYNAYLIEWNATIPSYNIIYTLYPNKMPTVSSSIWYFP